MVMRVKLKIANAWKAVRRIFIRPGGTYVRVRRVFEKVNGVWQFKWRDDRWQIWAMGSDCTTHSISNRGLNLNNKAFMSPGRSWNLLTLDQNGTAVEAFSFDIYGEYQSEISGEIVRMYDKLQSLPNGQLFCLYSWDEPKYGSDGRGFNGVMIRDLQSAVYRVGGTPSRYNKNYLQFRGAYILLSKVGVSTIYEEYVGAYVSDTAGDPAASIVIRFNVRENDVFEFSVALG